MKKEITTSVRQARDYKNILDENANKILGNHLFRKITLKEKIDFLRELALARSNLWATVYRDFPELRNFSDITITSEHIEFDNELVSTPLSSSEGLNKEER